MKRLNFFALNMNYKTKQSNTVHKNVFSLKSPEKYEIHSRPEKLP